MHDGSQGESGGGAARSGAGARSGRLAPPAFPPGQRIRTRHGERPASGYDDPVVADLAARLRRLATGLCDEGEAALRAASDKNTFETTLRAYCAGYLVAKRESEVDRLSESGGKPEGGG